MAIYVLLIFISLLFYVLPLKNKNNSTIYVFLFWGTCLLFTFVSAIRYNVGTDYINTYRNVLELLKIGLHYNYEFLFLKLNELVLLFNGDIVLLMFICSCFITFLFFKFIKENVDQEYWFLAIFLFIGTTIYYATMNAVRQYVAIAILLYAFKYLKNKKYIKYLLFNILAMLFHTSAIINIIIIFIHYFLKKDKISVLFVLVYLFSLVAIFIDLRSIFGLFSSFIPGRYLTYLNSVFMKEKNYAAIFKLIIPNLLLIFSFLKKKKLKEYPNFLLIYSAFYIYVIISNMFYGVNIFIRLGWYFEYYIILLIPILLDYAKNIKLILTPHSQIKLSSVLTLFVVVYFVALNVYSIFYSGGHGVVPYHTIWYYKNL